MKVSKDENAAPFHTTSMIQMPEGNTISREMLEKIFAESNETKTLIRHLVPKYFSEAKIVTAVSPEKSVPEMKKRTKRE
ncbi:hypothetical protein [Flavobacterium algicola]|uniref:hypothetical protein n=1 Tax=Flavobacterium algicola TaxID=556529 RepID=UPI001EFD3094|nr:hypothetical protein [Flavobacterium algicola]MCG9792666.1 hypothetical protein [Flavobacterium algicola]